MRALRAHAPEFDEAAYAAGDLVLRVADGRSVAREASVIDWSDAAPPSRTSPTAASWGRASPSLTTGAPRGAAA